MPVNRPVGKFECGFAHLIYILVLGILAVVLGWYLITQRIITLPVSLPGFPNSANSASEPTVNLTSDYQNPFDKDTQYVNPFEEYQNPFDSLK